MTSFVANPPLAEVMEHTGVKGMKWGVRKAYSAKVSRTTGRLDRVAKGTGSRTDKIVTLAGTSTHNLVTKGGLKGAAAAKSKDLKAQQRRLKQGKETAFDVLQMYGSISAHDLAVVSIRSRR